MKRHVLVLRIASAVAMVLSLGAHEARAQEPGCRNGGEPAVQAYLRHNFLYALYLGDLESYVTQNAARFRAESDAIKCVSALSRAYGQTSLRLYDPQDQQLRAQIEADLGAMGISPGRRESTASGDAFQASLRFARLARTLPAAANGDFAPLRTPTTELEQWEAVAIQIFRGFMSDPSMQAALAQARPKVLELINIEYRTLLAQASALAGQNVVGQGAAGQFALSCTGKCGMDEAIRALQAGNIAAARQAFLRVRNAEPSNEQWAITEGIAWYKVGRLADAEQANRRVLTINPKSNTGHGNLAFILFDLNRVSEALTHWEAALEIEEEPDAMAGKAIALRALGRHTEALDLYELAVLLNRDYLDCEVMRKKYYWSTIACAAAAPLIRQVR